MTAGSIAGAIAALGCVLALIWGVQAAFRLRLGNRGGARRLELTETVALDAKRRIHLVRCDRRWLLLQTGGTQDVVVGWLPESAVVDRPPP